MVAAQPVPGHLRRAAAGRLGQSAPLYHTPVDAIPDLSENQVIVFADWPGRSPQEVEDQVTYPLSVNLQGLAGVKTVRASSMFGFTFITVIFEENIDNYFARTRVLERLNYLGDLLPAGVVPKLGPDASGLGWVYQYYLAVDPASAPKGGYDLSQLRSLQDWFIRYQLNAVPGVAEVGSIGGFVRQYQVEVSPHGCAPRQVSLQDVLEAVEQSNLNVGGKVIEENGMEFVVRGLGLVESTGRPGEHRAEGKRRHAGLSAGCGHRPVRRRFPPGRAGRGWPGGGRRGGGDAQRRERPGRHPAGEGEDRANHAQPAARA